MKSAALRVGMIRYLNCLPFYFGLETMVREKGLAAKFLESHPADLCRSLAAGEIDLAPVSSIEYLMRQKDYLIFPDLAIGAEDFVRSVTLFSKVPVNELNHSTIALSEESLSSATLLKILLKLRFGFTNQFETVAQDPARILDGHKAALMIGDAALFFESEDWVYKYDLGAMWREWTGTPFVFALWTIRRESARERPEEIREIERMLKCNLERNLADPETLLRKASGILPTEQRFVQMTGYLANMRYGLDDEMIGGLGKFFRLAHEEKLAPEPQSLEFFL
ncbi:MAG: Chorismate dehydratase [Candidatus Omnitrophica bacterium ADurb.Bin277]|nr:MAG: Chorismate dehydratase [Candidatus Omnitrophica bacterium ADurb.Bin277]